MGEGGHGIAGILTGGFFAGGGEGGETQREGKEGRDPCCWCGAGGFSKRRHCHSRGLAGPPANAIHEGRSMEGHMGTSTHVKSQAMAQQLARRMRMRARLQEGSMHRRSPSNGSLSLHCRGAVLLFFSQRACGLLPALCAVWPRKTT